MRYASSGFAITPSDTVDISATTAGVYVGAAGTLQVTFLSGGTVELTVPAGLAPIVVTRVWATNTTATGLSGLRE